MRLLEFYTAWCKPCKEQKEILKNITTVEVKLLDAEEEANQELVEQYGIQVIPTILVFDDTDNVIKRFEGLTPIEEIQEVLMKNE